MYRLSKARGSSIKHSALIGQYEGFFINAMLPLIHIPRAVVTINLFYRLQELIQQPLPLIYASSQDAPHEFRKDSDFLQIFCCAFHSLATSSYLQNCTSSPRLFNHEIIRSIMPMTWAIPEVSGCSTSGKMKSPFPAPSPSSSSSCSW